MRTYEVEYEGEVIIADLSDRFISIQGFSPSGDVATATVPVQVFADFIATLDLPAPRTQQVVRATEVETGRSLVLVAQDGGFWYDGLKTYNDEELHVQFANITEV